MVRLLSSTLQTPVLINSASLFDHPCYWADNCSRWHFCLPFQGAWKESSFVNGRRCKCFLTCSNYFKLTAYRTRRFLFRERNRRPHKHRSVSNVYLSPRVVELKSLSLLTQSTMQDVVHLSNVGLPSTCAELPRKDSFNVIG